MNKKGKNWWKESSTPKKKNRMKSCLIKIKTLRTNLIRKSLFLKKRLIKIKYKTRIMRTQTQIFHLLKVKHLRRKMKKMTLRSIMISKIWVNLVSPQPTFLMKIPIVLTSLMMRHLLDTLKQILKFVSIDLMI